MAHMQIWGAVFERIHHSSRSCQKMGRNVAPSADFVQREPSSWRFTDESIIPENAEKPTGIRHPKERRTD